MNYLLKIRHFGVFAAIVGNGIAAQAADVAPPPRPPGFQLTEIIPGDSPVEKNRKIRAHHNKTHFKKDVTRDDTLDEANDDKGKGKGDDKGKGKGNDDNPKK